MSTQSTLIAEPEVAASPNPFISQGTVQDALQELQALRMDPDWRISDIVDDAGNQYVDFVLEGGGMLGIALAGYVYGLETAGIRFLRLGGTSAGAIVTMLLAGLKPRHEAAGQQLLDILAHQDFYEFVDGDEDAKDFTKTLLNRAETHKGLGAWLRNKLDIAAVINDGLQVIDNFRDRQGLHPGLEFQQWLHNLLVKAETHTIETLIQRRREVPAGGLKRRIQQPNGSVATEPYAPDDLCRLAIVAADITTQTKAIFPEMAPLYWADWKQVSPSELVRASMSVPFFFEPYRIHNLPGSEPGASDKYLATWHGFGYVGAKVPETAVFMDGGIMSNFPIDLFHNSERVPEAPTFGVKLGIDRNKPQDTDTFLQTLGAMFDATRTQYDFDFIQRNPDYSHLVHCLDVEKYNWLDFSMPEAKKQELFAIGIRGSVNFLRKFKWEPYKQLRSAKAELIKQSQQLNEMELQASPQKRTALTKKAIGVELDWPCGRPKYLHDSPAT
ncbi:patatin-like phospholipase family protein [Hymenobacter volaticus]|uniref:Patatin-like phospholipase family protein n=1 Tax=Hymenobacter volaticus TaxID=2932254 RepID=A0ABY4G6F3_9BACT|nr:patatin-like phospholipase family protein [Hymenobacter volaticus]UOQ66480.1 patatin-like phospholipase family protein [Hymenobacter volaticus]